jgi:hypothetical protein
MANGVIYLVRPLFGHQQLVGSAVIGPTWIEYSFPSNEPPPSLVPEPTALTPSPNGYRLLIPLTNVTAIAISDATDHQMQGRPTP